MNPKWLPLFILAYSVFVLAPVVSPPILNEPILLFSVDPVKGDGFGICGVNIADIGAIKGGAMGGQKGYRRGGSRRDTALRNTFCVWSEMEGDYFLALSCCDSCSRQDGPSMVRMME